MDLPRRKMFKTFLPEELPPDAVGERPFYILKGAGKLISVGKREELLTQLAK